MGLEAYGAHTLQEMLTVKRMTFLGELKCIKILLMGTMKWMQISLSHSTYLQKRFDHLELT